MWEKKEGERNRKDFTQTPGEPLRTAAAPDFQVRASQAKIGESLFIKGEVTGGEDLTVEGSVEGRIHLKDHNLTIGPKGRVRAEIHAKHITIVGEVTGNVVADEKVDLTDTANLVGDIRAPRISVSDGARFKGSVDMVQAAPKKEKQETTHASSKDSVSGKKVLQPAVQVSQTAKSVQ